MNRVFLTLIAVLVISSSAFAQNGPAPKPSTSEKTTASPAAAASSPAELAKLTLAAHGGDKLKSMKSMLVRGSVDVNVMGQALPGAFSTAYSGDKYYFEINSAVQQMKQVYDGKQMFSSVAPFSLPPITSVGFPVIAKIGDSGYVVGPLPEKGKKRNGFRVTTPEGFYTDFIVDEKTSQIKSYDSAFEVNGQVVTTSVDIEECLTIDGLIVPKKYSQRFNLGQITAYASFKAKDIKVNSPMEDSAFALPK